MTRSAGQSCPLARRITTAPMTGAAKLRAASRDGGRPPHPAGRGPTVASDNPWEGDACGQSASSPADPQAVTPSTACTGRASESDPLGRPLTCDGRRGHAAGRAPRDDIALGDLSAHERHIVWRGIQRLEPALAHLLRDDQGLRALRRRFGGTYHISYADYCRYYRAGEEDAPCTSA